MKTLRYSLLLIPCCLLCVSSLAQGPLAPSGAPAPTMKSLDQLEARTPISTAPFVISTSGSYYLTNNLTVSTGNAITISVSNVTLDLNGFTISSTKSPAGGVAVNGALHLRNVTVLNGAINSSVTVSGGTYSGSGFSEGVSFSSPDSVRVSGVSVSGCLGNGIYAGQSSCVVENCTVNIAGANGIVASAIFNSTAINIGATGIIGGNVNGCYATAVKSGIDATTVTNSFGSSSGATTPGILAYTVQNSWGVGIGDCGVRASNIDNCYGTTYGNSSGGGVYGIVVNNSRGDSSGSCAGLRADVVVSNSYGYNASSGPGLVAGTAQNCNGYAAGAGVGLTAELATNCRGSSNTSYGLDAEVANGCKGTSNGTNAAPGIRAYLVNGSYGNSPDTGIYANTVNGSRGVSTGGGNAIDTSFGFAGFGAVSYSQGISNGGAAISSNVAIGSTGDTTSSYSRTFLVSTAAFCYGYNHGGAPALDAYTSFLFTGGFDTSHYHYFDNTGSVTFP